MKIRSLNSLGTDDLKGKKILVRVDYNCPIQDGKVADDTRILATIPTLDYLLGQGAKPILISHLGRPKGKTVPEMSLRPVLQSLEGIAKEKWPNVRVLFADDCIGSDADAALKDLDGEGAAMLLLENLRFHKSEEDNDRDFAKALASYANLFIQDAFGTVHRAHASTQAVTEFLPSYAGFLVEKELKSLGELMENPPRPFVAVIGGSKVSTKIEILESLNKKVDVLLIGGGMTYTFLKAKDIPIGSSILEKEFLGQAFSIMSRAHDNNTEFILPVDHLAASGISQEAKTKVVAQNGIPEDWYGVDLGPKTISLYQEKIKKAGTVFWNGPVGIFEIDKFAKGTEGLAKALQKTKAKTIAGGGDVINALHKFKVADSITHISTGGGASLEFLSGKKLPGVLPLLEQ